MKYELFVLERCPYCNKVRSYLEGTDFDVEILPIDNNTENEFRQKQIGGKRQVPMLLIDGEEYMFESDDIIEYFKGLE